mmetsp:Transcript_4143/g.26185  ORF Transcript_4143/g.26185 Transcript_4143/m.26185 type:complete len:104 (-) Transcript_4143:268-579(-)
MQQFLHPHDRCGLGPLALESPKGGNILSAAVLLRAEKLAGSNRLGFSPIGLCIARFKGGLLLHVTTSCHANVVIFPLASTFEGHNDQLSIVLLTIESFADESG